MITQYIKYSVNNNSAPIEPADGSVNYPNGYEDYKNIASLTQLILYFTPKLHETYYYFSVLTKNAGSIIDVIPEKFFRWKFNNKWRCWYKR